MALARTDLVSSAGPDPGDDIYTSGSFTPPNNSLLVVAAGLMETNGTTDLSGDLSLSGGSLSWTKLVPIGATPAYAIGLAIWTAEVTTGASMTVAVTANARLVEFGAISAVAYTGYDTGSPVGATVTSVDTATPDGAHSMTLSGAPATTSEVFAGIFIDKESVGVTPGAAFTEIHDVQHGAFGGLETEIRTGSTSTTVDWVDTHTGTGLVYKFVAAAIEIKEAAGGGAATYVMRAAAVAP